MPVVAFPSQPNPATSPNTAGPMTATAVERFLDSIAAATTRVGYAETLTRLITVTGAEHPTAALTPEHYAAVMDRWKSAASATWNRHLSALCSFTTWAQRHETLATNPAAGAPQNRPPRRSLHPALSTGDPVHRRPARLAGAAAAAAAV